MIFDHGHALLIGVGSPPKAPGFTIPNAAHSDVPITVADAQAIAAVLCDAQYCGYPASQVTLLRAEEATRDGILDALDQLAAHTTAGDTVLLFYCGHGLYGDDGSYYLTSFDTCTAGRKVTGGTGVSQQALLTRLKALKAQRMLLIFNACHSGAVTPTLGGDDTPEGNSLPDTIAAALLATGEGRIIITACREKQYSFIGEGALTIFTEALVDGLRGKGMSSQRGYISAFDLYSYVHATVSQVVRSGYQRQQEPELTILKGVGPMAVALYRGNNMPGTLGSESPPAQGAVHQVSREESQRQFQQIISGSIVGSNVGTIDDTSTRITAGDITGVSGQVALGRDITQHNGGIAPAPIEHSSGELFRLLNSKLQPGDIEAITLTMDDYSSFNIDPRILGAELPTQIHSLIQLCRKQKAMTALIRSLIATNKSLLAADEAGWQTWAAQQDVYCFPSLTPPRLPTS